MSYLEDAAKEYADQHGALSPDRAWINTPLDSWEPNPHYKGPPVPHPESDPEEENISMEWDEDLLREFHAECANGILIW